MPDEFSAYIGAIPAPLIPGIHHIFERARQEAPCILVFEDLDSMITDQNRYFFLNEVDGLADNDGILMASPSNIHRVDIRSGRPTTLTASTLASPTARRASTASSEHPLPNSTDTSSFPNPTKDQRIDYARYWQDKLKDNHDIEFPDALLDEFASKTDDFSFAYMKEAL